MIGAGLPLHCVALDATGSYDTHAGQTAALTPALTTTAASLFAFQRDLEARGVADRVLTFVWSEFGRRAKENGSGTDHGAAGTAFLIGTRRAGQQVGEYLGLASGLDDDGNLKPSADFRGVYSALLEQWLSFDASRIIPDAKKFQRPTSSSSEAARRVAFRDDEPRRRPRTRRPRRPGCRSWRRSTRSRSRDRPCTPARR